MLKTKSKVGFELGVGHLQLRVVSPVNQLLAVVFQKERLFSIITTSSLSYLFVANARSV